MKISELNEDQKSHLAWRLEHNTYVGYGTACRIARGEFGDLTLEECFLKADKPLRWAKYFAQKVLDFKVSESRKQAMDRSMMVFKTALDATRGLDSDDIIWMCESLAESLKGYAKTTRSLVEHIAKREQEGG
jgi:hypothetical protein